MSGSTKRGDNGQRASSSENRKVSQDSSPSLDRVVQAQIGDKLRNMYGELLDQPVPDRLADIIKRLGTER